MDLAAEHNFRSRKGDSNLIDEIEGIDGGKPHKQERFEDEAAVVTVSVQSFSMETGISDEPQSARKRRVDRAKTQERGSGMVMRKDDSVSKRRTQKDRMNDETANKFMKSAAEVGIDESALEAFNRLVVSGVKLCNEEDPGCAEMPITHIYVHKI